MNSIAPTTVSELTDIVADAANKGVRLEIRGGGSKVDIGGPRDATTLDMRRFARVIDYDPAELTLTVGAGTPLTEVENLLDARGQMLAFEPWDHGPIFGRAPGLPTLGGVIAAGIAGSRRLGMGAARDHLLGFEAVSGRGERFIGGAKVVKNVTGYDLPKVMAGSWGRLAAMTQLTVRVVPKPRMQITVAIDGLSYRQAHSAMTQSLCSSNDISAAAHVPAWDGRDAVTVFRLGGFEPSVKARLASLLELMCAYGKAYSLEGAVADVLWHNIRSASYLADSQQLWRINVVPSRACDVIDVLMPLGVRWFFDWAGGLVWLGFEGEPEAVRSAAGRAGGHAMLVRAPENIRAIVPAQHPREPGVVALEARVRRAFDPAGVFETRRFLDDAHAD